MERKTRVENMVAQMDTEGFGVCTNPGSCAAECPVGIKLENIATLNREEMVAKATSNTLAGVPAPAHNRCNSMENKSTDATP